MGDVMKKDKALKKKPAPQYNKNNSKAKEIVDEAAEESEDEISKPPSSSFSST
jgi:mediator of replication checkpoint protein 1